MIIGMVKKWEENKDAVELYFRNTRKDEHSYKSIVKKLFEICFKEFDVSKMTVIDDGSYSGTQIFIIPKDTYQPFVDDYIFTNNSYGSCSGCDTLQALYGCSNELPNEDEIKGYMTLCLHLVQKLKKLGCD